MLMQNGQFNSNCDSETVKLLYGFNNRPSFEYDHGRGSSDGPRCRISQGKLTLDDSIIDDD